jgi:hypothetical protein
MSIQLTVCTPTQLFESLLEPLTASEGRENLASFIKFLTSEVKSFTVDLDRPGFAENLGFYVGAREAVTSQDIALREFPELRFVSASELYVPCSNIDERFYLEYAFTCRGKEVTWRITDINSLREWISALRNSQLDASQDDLDLLDSYLKKHELAADMAEEHRGLLFFSY